MRTWKIMLVLVLLALTVKSETAPAREDGAKSQPKTVDSISLAQAVKDGNVTLSATGSGQYSGNCLRVKIQRNVAADMDVVLTPGTVFVSKSRKVQNLVCSGAINKCVGNRLEACERISLTDDKEVDYVFEAYCLNFKRKTPGEKDLFTISTPNENAITIIKLGKEQRGSSDETIQAAIWIACDKTLTLAMLKTRLKKLNYKRFRAARRLTRALKQKLRKEDSARFGTLFVETKPQNASIKILHPPIATFTQGMELKPRIYIIEVSFPGYKTQQRTVTISKGAATRIRVRL